MKKVKTGMALFFAATLLVFFGCENSTTPLPEEEEEPVLSSDAGLLSISLNSTEGELADPVPRSEWENGAFSQADMPLSYLSAATHEALAAATITATPSDSTAQIRYGLGTANTGPTVWEASGQFELHNNDYVYIVVTAENLQDRNYYKALVNVRGSEARLDTLTIAGNQGILAPAASLIDVVPQAVRIEYGTQSVLVEAEPVDALAALRFAKVPYENIGSFNPETLAWGEEAASSFAEGDRLYVKCTSPDGASVLYYGFEIKLRNHITLSLGDKPAASIGNGYDVLNIPTTTLLNGAAAISTAEGASGLVIVASPRAGSGATVTGYAIVAASNNSPTFTTSGIESGYTSEAITHGQHLWVQVGTRTGEAYYYRIVIAVLSNTATLTNITVGGATVSGTAGIGTPQSDPWAGTDNTGSVIVPRAQAAPNATTVSATAAQALATVTWARAANETAIPAAAAFSNTPIAGGLAAGNYLFVKSVSPDGSTTLYYKLAVADVKNNDVSLAGLTIDGQPGIAFTPGEGGTAVNVAAASRGTLSLTTAQAAAVSKVIRAIPTDSNATITAYAIAASNATNPTLVTSNIDAGYTHTTAIADTNHLFIRVQAEDGVTIRFYRLIITVLSNNPALTAITVGGVTASLGTPQNAAWSGTENTGAVPVPPAQTAPSSTSVATTATQTASVRTWAVAATANDIPPESAFSGTTPIAGGVANGQYLFVKSVSPDGSAALYYKLALTVKNNVTTLASAAIGGVSATSLGTGDTTVNVGTGAGLRGAINLTTAQAALTSRVILAVVSTGSNAAVTGYAIAASTNNNPAFIDTGIESGYTYESAITNGQHLFIRVEAENGINIQYYRLVINVLSNDPALTAITIGGIAAGALGTPQTAAWSGTSNAGTVDIPPAAATPNATSVATTAAQTAAVRTWAVAANATAIPAEAAFNNTTPIEAGLSAGQYLFVKSVSPDGSATLYYKLAVAIKNNVATLASAALDGSAVETLPTPNAAWASAAAQTKTYASAPATVTLSAVPTAGSNAIVHYAASATGAAPASGDWSTSLSLSSPGSGTYIAVRVTAENGVTVNYYRWRLSIGSSAATISSVTVAGKEQTTLGTPGTAYNAGVTDGTIHLTSAQVTAGRQIVVTSANNVSIRVGTSTSNNTAPTNYVALAKTGPGPYTYTGTIPGNAMSGSTRISLEVTAENAITVAFYRIRVTTANSAVAGALTVGGVTKNSNWGTPAGAWNAAQLVNGAAITLTAAQAADAAISHSGGTNAGTVTYAKTSDTITEPVFAALPASNVTFANGDFLYIRLVYTSGTATYRNIYRVPVVVTE